MIFTRSFPRKRESTRPIEHGNRKDRGGFANATVDVGLFSRTAIIPALRNRSTRPCLSIRKIIANNVKIITPEAGTTRISVFDVAGRFIRTLTDEPFSSGEHHLAFDASALPTGIYFIQMQSGSFVTTQKILLLK